MLFRNIKTGNIVSPSDEATVELMQKSPNYEQVEAPAEAKTIAKTEVEPAKGSKKPAAKKTGKND